MKNISASTYNVFYANSQIGHSLFYQGVRVVEFTTAGEYFRLTFYNGKQINICAADTLTVQNKNYFVTK